MFLLPVRPLPPALRPASDLGLLFSTQTDEYWFPAARRQRRGNPWNTPANIRHLNTQTT